MEIRLVIFLFFTTVTFVTNTMLLWFAYRGFANLKMKITRTAREFETNSMTVAWLNSLQMASERALTLTEIAKQKIAGYEPVLNNAQSRYGYALAKVDVKMEKLEEEFFGAANRIQKTFEAPAFAITAFAAGIHGVAATIGPDFAEDSD